MAINMGTAIAYLELDTTKFQKGFTSAYNDLKVFGDKTATAEQKIKGLQSAFKTVGGVLTKNVTVPLAGAGAVALKYGSDFESAMSQVAATMGTTTDKIQDLTEFAEKMGATTAFSATEASQGLNILAQSGLNATEQMQALPDVLNLASAGALRLDQSATYVIGTIKGFGDVVANASKYTDLIAKGATLANTNVAGLGEALSGTSATANSYNQSVESVTLSLLRLAEQNVTSAEASTALNRAMMDLYTPTSTAKKALDELGISAYDAEGNARDFNEVIDELNNRLSGMSDEEKNVYKNTIFTTYGLQAFNKMTTSTTETIDKFKNGLADASGSAMQQAQTQLDNLKGDITLFKSALEGAGISIANVLIPMIRNLVQGVTELLTKFNNLSDSQKEIIVRIGLVVASVGPMLLIFTKLIRTFTTVFKVIKTVNTQVSLFIQALSYARKGITITGTQIGKIFPIFNALKTALLSISAPVYAVVALIGVLVGAFITLWKTSEDFRNKIIDTFGQIKETAQSFVNGIKERFNELGISFDFVKDVLNVLKQIWIEFCNIIAPLFMGALQIVADTIKLVFNMILSIFDIFVGKFTGDTDKVVDGVKSLVSGIIEAFSNIVSTILSTVGDIGARILTAFGFDGIAEDFQGFFDFVANLFNQLPEAISFAINAIVTFFTETIPNAFETLISLLPTFIESIKNFFSQLPYYIGYAIGLMLGHIYQFGVDIITWAQTAIPEFIENVVTFFSELPSRIWEWLIQTHNTVQQASTDTLNSVVQWGSNMIQQAIQIASGFVNSFITFLSELPSNVWNIIVQIPDTVKGIVSDMLQAGEDIFNSLWDGIKSVGDSIVSWVEGFADTVLSFVNGIIDGFKSVVSGANDAKTAARSVDGSHANGLDYVPYNGYVAELHEGERVLTKQQNKEYNEGRTSGGDTFNFYNTKPDPYEYARQMKKAKKELLFGI